MCGPFVIAQVSNRLEKTPLDKFSNFEKLKNLSLAPYHLGRATTYSFLGFLCALLFENIQDIRNFNFVSAGFLFFASLSFLIIFLGKLNFELKTLKKISILLAHKFSYIYNAAKFPFSKKRNKKKRLLSLLFKDPRGFKGYILGIILGFIPCGLLYGAFAIAINISNPYLAGFGMFLFAIGTFPSLFLTACGGYVFFKIDAKFFKIISLFILVINAATLFFMALKLIN